MRARDLALPLLSLVGLAACVENLPSPTDGLVTSIELDLLAPSQGSPGQPNLDRQASFNLIARADDGAPYPGDATFDLYVSYGGVLTGLPQDCGVDLDTPIETLMIHGGVLMNHQVMLPVAYGSTALWVQERGSHVVGASPTIYFPNPTIPSVQTPPNPKAPNATFCSSFEKKFVTVDQPTGAGELLVDSVFGGAITVTDTGATDFRSIYLFTFGRPPRDLIPGRHIKSFNGNVSKFIGFTEVNFPIIVADDDAPVEPQKLPAPLPFSVNDLNNQPKLNAANSAVIEVTALVCPPIPANAGNDPNIQKTIDSWIKYNTFYISLTPACDGFSSFGVQLPSKVVGTFDPTMIIGKSITVRGMLKNTSGQNPVLDTAGNPVACKVDADCMAATVTCVNSSCKKAPYNFWTIAVRDANDLPQ